MWGLAPWPEIELRPLIGSTASWARDHQGAPRGVVDGLDTRSSSIGSNSWRCSTPKSSPVFDLVLPCTQSFFFFFWLDWFLFMPLGPSVVLGPAFLWPLRDSRGWQGSWVKGPAPQTQTPPLVPSHTACAEPSAAAGLKASPASFSRLTEWGLTDLKQHLNQLRVKLPLRFSGSRMKILTEAVSWSGLSPCLQQGSSLDDVHLSIRCLLWSGGWCQPSGVTMANRGAWTPCLVHRGSWACSSPVESGAQCGLIVSF